MAQHSQQSVSTDLMNFDVVNRCTVAQYKSVEWRSIQVKSATVRNAGRALRKRPNLTKSISQSAQCFSKDERFAAQCSARILAGIQYSSA